MTLKFDYSSKEIQYRILVEKVDGCLWVGQLSSGKTVIAKSENDVLFDEELDQIEISRICQTFKNMVDSGFADDIFKQKQKN